jgi:N-acylneuraminate cytidylyltransferase
MSTVIIIPARGGSQRIPFKNIKLFCGKALIGWTIEAARNALPDVPVYVSSDSPEILRVGESFGAFPLPRHGQNSDHQTTVQQATIGALRQLQGKDEWYTTIIQLLATCPNRDAADIRRHYRAFTDSERTFQLSCYDYGDSHPWWAHRLRPDGTAIPLFPEALKMRSQDLEPLYQPSGAIWISKTTDLLDQGTFYGQGYCMEKLRYGHAIDIDTEDDWLTAKIYRQMMPETGVDDR